MVLGPSPGLNLRHLRKSQGQTEVENLGYHGWPNKGILPWSDLGVTNSAAINLSLLLGLGGKSWVHSEPTKVKKARDLGHARTR